MTYWVEAEDIGRVAAESFNVAFTCAQALGDKPGRIVTMGDEIGALARMWRESDGTYVAQPGPRFAGIRQANRAQ